MIDLVVSALAAAVLYKPFGIGGIVAGTGIGTSAAVFAQAYILRRKFDGLELGRLLSTDDPHLDRLGGAGRGQLGDLGRPRPAPWAAALPPRSSRWARAWCSARSPTSRSAWMLRIAELEQILRLLRRRRG